jgi:hypothetical protein
VLFDDTRMIVAGNPVGHVDLTLVLQPESL